MRDFATSDDPEVQAQLDRLASLSQPQGRIGIAAIRELLARLDDPQRHIPPAFHVAGTNGKGSVCAFLRAMLEAEGLTVHVATSPHLVRYNERIRIAGKLIEDDELAALLKEVLDTADELPISFFEATIAASFLAFSRHKADACVIEVGLGGRFDATNVLERPVACGIATLGIDHERFLLAPEAGVPEEPLARIAFEKAGIVKPGVPVATMAYPLEAEFEIERAAGSAGAPLHMRGKDWDASVGTLIDYRDRHGALTLPLPTLPGTHQAENAALAIAMLRHQDHVTVSPAGMAEGIRTARWPARLQLLGDGPLTALLPASEIWLDGGHNRNAAEAIARFLAARGRPVLAIVGMLANKDARGFLETIAPHVFALAAVPVPGHECHAPLDLAAMAKTSGVDWVHTAESVAGGLKMLKRHIRPGEENDCTIVIAGTLYLAGEVLRLNGECPD